MSVPRLASVSVDLDSLPHYCRIHGLPEALLDDRARALVHEVAIPRYLSLFADAGIPGTFFVIGADLAQPGAAAALRAAHRAGVELGNHSQSHDYRLSQLPRDEIRAELSSGADAILAAVGERPVGFRAPGYTLSAPLLQEIEAQGYAYDSSAYPAAPYYLAKASVMGALAVLGRPSGALLDSPRVLLAPTGPYHPDPEAPYRRGAARTLELPIAVEPLTRAPFIGTVAAAFPSPLVRALYLATRRLRFFNFELHAIDVLDVSDGIPEPLARAQRDLFVPRATKLQRLARVLAWIASDYQVVTLAAAASRLRGSRGTGE